MNDLKDKLIDFFEGSLVLAQVILVLLKLADVITWPWIWVFCILWGSFLFVILFLIVSFIYVLFIERDDES